MSESTLQKLWEIANLIPCEMCRVKGHSNILADGGCRHRPVLDGEMLVRLKWAAEVAKATDTLRRTK
jgi:hypothetical protein